MGAQARAQGLGNRGFAHRLVHARQPLVALADADAKRQVPSPQARVPKPLDIVLWPAEPAAQEPEQTLARVGQVIAMHGPQGGIGRLQIHQIVEALNQRTHARFTADNGKGTGCGLFHGHFLIVLKQIDL